MTDQMNVAPRHGLRGVKRHSTPIPEASATAPSTLDGVPPASNFTFGRKGYGMQGNAEWSNCWWAMLVHACTVQATVSYDEATGPVFIDGYTPLGPNTGVEWYNEYQKSQGQATEPPGEGTDPYQGALLALQLGLVYAIGTLGPTDRLPDGTPYFAPDTVAQCIYDFQGGVGFLLALDADAEQEFDDNEPWGTQSSVPDQADGHATLGVAYQQGNPITTCITWAALEGMLELFDQNCIEGLTLVITKGFVLKNGQAAADALVSKWGLQVAKTEQPADTTPPIEPVAPPSKKDWSVPTHVKDAVDKLVTEGKDAIHFGAKEITDAEKQAKKDWREATAALGRLVSWTTTRNNLHQIANTVREVESLVTLATELATLTEKVSAFAKAAEGKQE
jgi:hypothetical protein